MKLRTLLLIGMAIALLFALALLLRPAIILTFFGLTGTPGETLLAQAIGAGLIGVGVLSWFAKDFADSQALRGTLMALLIASAVAFVVSLLGVLAKVPTGKNAGNAWIIVILLLAFAVGLAYFQFFGPRE